MNTDKIKEYMVLGIKGNPMPDEKTEKDNPYIFNSLERALEVAKEISKEHDGYGYGAIVRLDYLEEFYGEKLLCPTKTPIQKYTEEMIDELYISLQYCIDREGNFDKTSTKNQLRDSIVSLAQEAKREILQELLKKTENGGFAPMIDYDSSSGAIANIAVRRWAENKLKEL